MNHYKHSIIIAVAVLIATCAISIAGVFTVRSSHDIGYRKGYEQGQVDAQVHGKFQYQLKRMEVYVVEELKMEH
jgi:flagellar basal body-associated protein FliL